MEALTESLTRRIYNNKAKPSINSLTVSKIDSLILLVPNRPWHRLQPQLKQKRML
ncbi:hypothetical protein Goarm_019523 [Gossypium armourianum]|uniref:Uncharacterized protein n=1 Tax=Gossypium armourianum TaxID=34283 RepID=A0A7J9IKT6_9ROSI|nr:hypothetical protein [Gossypium armourianum]